MGGLAFLQYGKYEFWLPDSTRVLFVEPDQLDEVFDSEVGERLDAVFSDAIDPDDAILDFHFVGDVREPIFVFAEVFRDLGDDGDVMDLVDVHGHAARAEIADAGVQFQGRSSFSR